MMTSRMQKSTRRHGLLVFVALFLAWMPQVRAQSQPNIVLIYLAALGYGDVSSYGATAFQTPHIDRLAREGLRFTDAHATAATCTPSRYALLTGEHAWRKPRSRTLPGAAGARPPTRPAPLTAVPLGAAPGRRRLAKPRARHPAGRRGAHHRAGPADAPG